MISFKVIDKPSPRVTITKVIGRRISEKKSADMAVKISAKIGKRA